MNGKAQNLKVSQKTCRCVDDFEACGEQVVNHDVSGTLPTIVGFKIRIVDFERV